jgi:acyl carrier protein
MSIKPINTEKTIKSMLAKQLGTEPDDINNDDSLTSDLLMKASDLTDLLEKLESEGLDTTRVNLIDIDTVDDLIEKLSDEI